MQSCILNVYKITKLEFMTHDEAHDCFGSKGKTNAALTLKLNRQRNQKFQNMQKK